MLVVEVNGGFCRKPFECEFLPRPSYSSLFVDITDVHPTPDIYWRYDYARKTFHPPAGDIDDPESEYAIQHRWNEVRNQRQIFLLESDWTQLPDAFPMKAWRERRRWKKYRQELRDLPQKYSGDNPMFVVFPPKPANIIRPSFIGRVKAFIAILRSKG